MDRPPSFDADRIPVCRPLLPTAERLVTYLTEIDENRWYSNHGKLVRQLEARLSKQLGQTAPAVTTASSGVAALVGAILATAGRATPERPYAVLPAYTFIGTISAVELCGYIPYLVDVDPQTWCLEAGMLTGHSAVTGAGLVVPVAAYGRAVEQQAWQDWQARSGVPVVIDGAAAFEALCDAPTTTVGTIPVALSFQATKTFCTGEGGAVVCPDSGTMTRVEQALNFGFDYGRITTASGMNGKMSEYHAAVGLAELDGWTAKRAAFDRVGGLYRAAAYREGLAEALIVAPSIAGNYAIFDAGDAQTAQQVSIALASRSVGHRRWYGLGLQHHPYLAATPRDPLPVTDDLAPRLIGVPVSVDLSENHVDSIVGVLARAAHAARPARSLARP